MPAKLYILAGPAGAGNRFGYYRDDRIPSGKFAVVIDDGTEYANGGYGPCVLSIHDTLESAEIALQRESSKEAR